MADQKISEDLPITASEMLSAAVKPVFAVVDENEADPADRNKKMDYSEAAKLGYVGEFDQEPAGFTISSAHLGTDIETTGASPHNITVPTHADDPIPIGARFPIIWYGAGQPTIVPASGVTIHSDGEDNVVPTRYKPVVLVKRANNEWYLWGIGNTGSTGGGSTEEAPLLVSATVADANPDRIILEYDKTLNAASVPATGDFAVSGGKTVSAVAIVSLGVGTNNGVRVTVNSAYANGDVITISYTPGTNTIEDSAGNDAAALTNELVTNNVAASGGGSGIREAAPLDILTGVNANTTNAYTYALLSGAYERTVGSGTAYGHLLGLSTHFLAAGEEGMIDIGTPNGWNYPHIIGFNTTAVGVSKDAMPIGLRFNDTNVWPIVAGVEGSSSLFPGGVVVEDANFRIGIRKIIDVGLDEVEWQIVYSTNNGSSWNLVASFPPGTFGDGTIAGDQDGYFVIDTNGNLSIYDPQMTNFTEI